MQNFDQKGKMSADSVCVCLLMINNLKKTKTTINVKM